MIGSMDGKRGGVYVEYVLLIVSCYWIEVLVTTIFQNSVWYAIKASYFTLGQFYDSSKHLLHCSWARFKFEFSFIFMCE